MRWWALINITRYIFIIKIYYYYWLHPPPPLKKSLVRASFLAPVIYVFGVVHQVAMGQGQADIALQLLHDSARNGEWLCLKNLHLVTSWLPTLEKASLILGSVYASYFMMLLNVLLTIPPFIYPRKNT